MFNAVHLENFKCFEYLDLTLKPLTILTGFNGGGKSTSIQPLLLAAQSARLASGEEFLLNGRFVQLGTAGDVLAANADSKVVVIGLANEDARLTVELDAAAGLRSLPVRSAMLVNSGSSEGTEMGWFATTISSSQLAVALHNLTFLSSSRGASIDTHAYVDAWGQAFVDVGAKGEGAACIYDARVDEEISEDRSILTQPGRSLRNQVDAYLDALFPGAKANVVGVPQVAALALQFKFGLEDWRRPTNVGYGLSYAFPIIVALLTLPKGGTLVVDSPEAHLHPSAQSKMGELFARASAAGVQIIVETHSDHFVNGVRKAVKAKTLSNSDVELHFFNGNSAEDVRSINTLKIDENGRIDLWPAGFFDQTDNDLAILSGWDR